MDDDCDLAALKKERSCYIVAHNGTYLKQRTSMFNSITPVKNLRHLKDVQTFAKINLPKLTVEQLCQVVCFFKDVYDKRKSEVMVLLYYNFETKEMIVRPPEVQSVTAASISYEVDIQSDDFVLCGSIHSHASMNAFHSATDVADEMDFDGLHITLGNFNTDDYLFTFSSEIVVDSNRFKYDVKDWFEGEKFIEAPRENASRIYNYGHYGYGGGYSCPKNPSIGVNSYSAKNGKLVEPQKSPNKTNIVKSEPPKKQEPALNKIFTTVKNLIIKSPSGKNLIIKTKTTPPTNIKPGVIKTRTHTKPDYSAKSISKTPIISTTNFKTFEGFDENLGYPEGWYETIVEFKHQNYLTPQKYPYNRNFNSHTPIGFAADDDYDYLEMCGYGVGDDNFDTPPVESESQTPSQIMQEANRKEFSPITGVKSNDTKPTKE